MRQLGRLDFTLSRTLFVTIYPMLKSDLKRFSVLSLPSHHSPTTSLPQIPHPHRPQPTTLELPIPNFKAF